MTYATMTLETKKWLQGLKLPTLTIPQVPADWKTRLPEFTWTRCAVVGFAVVYLASFAFFTHMALVDDAPKATEIVSLQ